MHLSEAERERYHRQMLIEGWGEEGQRKLKEARVFIAGAGGLGSPVAIYLAVAGVGEIHICDADRIELSNLNRQILHPEARVGELKALSAQKTLEELNPHVRVVPHAEYLDASNAERIIGQPDVIVDCLDNFETRYVLNEYAVRHNIPMVHGAIWGMMGQVTFLHPPETPCFRCLFPEAPPKAVFPVVGATPGIIGSLQALEVLKYLTGVGKNLKGYLLVCEGDESEVYKFQVERAPDCPVCGYLTA